MSKLFIIGTPIGNLEDITFRALRTLKEVDVLACEDTRVTTKLLAHFGIENKRLITYNNFTEKQSTKGILQLLEQGQNIGLVSDAGMPAVSDPGFELIKQAREHNFDIEIIPGVSASITAFVGAGFSNEFTFLGFLKDKSSQRQSQLKNLDFGTYVFYVSPHKLKKSLEDIDQVFGGLEKICLVKELTKVYERWFFGTAKEILTTLKLENLIKGEFTMVLHLSKPKKEKTNKYAHLRGK